MTKQELFEQLCAQLGAEDLFFGHGVIDEEDEAMMILMSVLNESVATILTTGHEYISEFDITQSKSFAEQRLQSKKPMAYVLGQAYFADLKFLVDERVLVPRSPIAELILNNFADVLPINEVKNALDLCTGSGCIGLALAHYHGVPVTLSDISAAALQLAEKNKELLELEKTKIVESDLFEKIDESYDLIVSNPPYVSEAEYESLPAEYKKEPKLGLVTPIDGLQIPLQILAQAPDYLSDKGHLLLEVGYSDELLESVLPEIDFRWLEFEHGGQGVCVFSREELLKYRAYFIRELKQAG